MKKRKVRKPQIFELKSKTKTFEQIIYEFKMELAKKYGHDDAIVKIALKPDVFNQVVFDLHSTNKYSYFFQQNVIQANLPIDKLGELKIMDIQLLSRERDSF